MRHEKKSVSAASKASDGAAPAEFAAPDWSLGNEPAGGLHLTAPPCQAGKLQSPVALVTAAAEHGSFGNISFNYTPADIKLKPTSDGKPVCKSYVVRIKSECIV